LALLVVKPFALHIADSPKEQNSAALLECSCARAVAIEHTSAQCCCIYMPP